ncbi:hypothetical protein HY622_03430 [Candidatus Uhrbacteria bacterium]|nr:hypothetical protein [Candidatus Uhrbacteria bacterium]
MPRRSTTREHIRNIQQSKGSYLVSIPIRIIRELGWKQRQKVIVAKRGSRVEIADWPKKGT